MTQFTGVTWAVKVARNWEEKSTEHRWISPSLAGIASAHRLCSDGAKDHLGAHQELAVEVRFEGEALDPIGHGTAQLLGLHCAGGDIITLMGIHGRISSPGLAKGTLVMRVAMR